MRQLTRRILFFFLLPAILTAFCGEALARDDWQYWNGFGLKAKLSDQFKATLGNELRVTDDFTDLTTANLDLGLFWTPSKYFEIGPKFKYEHEKKGGGVHVNENRWYLEATLKTKVKGFGLSSRQRMAYRNKNTEDSWRYRNEFKLTLPSFFEKYPVTPYASEEIFWDLNEEQLNQNRIKLGFTTKVHEHVWVNLYYMIKSNKKGGPWDEAHVLGTGLTVSV